MSISEKKGLLLPKKGIFIFSCIYDPVYNHETIGLLQKNKKQQSASKRRSILHLLYCFQGEGACKRFSRIRRHCTGISIKRTEKWLNISKYRFKTNLIFSNKPPSTPVISKSVQGCN